MQLTSNVSMGISRCAHLLQWFGDRKYDIFLLAVFCYIIVVMAVIAGGLLLCKLLKIEEKRRTDMFVIILSIPDICVGFVLYRSHHYHFLSQILKSYVNYLLR